MLNFPTAMKSNFYLCDVITLWSVEPALGCRRAGLEPHMEAHVWTDLQFEQFTGS